MNNEKAATSSAYQKFAGSTACASCHKNIYEDHKGTAHFHTSEIAAAENIKGSFEPGKNSYSYPMGGNINMEKRAGGLYQVGYINGEEKKSERFDITIGAAAEGQSYASWVGNKLVQLPITFFTSAGEWSNSPGYPNKMAFNRPITSRCLECHATYAERTSLPEKDPEEFDKTRMVLGVDCEKCHGPAADHITYQQQHPEEKTAKFILNPASFTRQQQLDLCAVCHGGRLQKKTASFSFKAGDKLTDHFTIDTTGRDVASIDVHGNQYGLMAASKCFKMSTTLTCNSCHDAHKQEKDAAATFAHRCMNCHTGAHDNAPVCKMTATVDSSVLISNCINCHMPKQPSMAIAVILQGQQAPTPALMHTHLVKAYPGETKQILALVKATQQNLSAAKK